MICGCVIQKNVLIISYFRVKMFFLYYVYSMSYCFCIDIFALYFSMNCVFFILSFASNIGYGAN